MPRRGRLEGDLAIKDLPKEFDSRKKWPKCKTIAQIRDQGHCGSCWAFGAVEALSDRFCIHQNVDVEVSANDVLACCMTCGDGCGGGFPASAWQYFQDVGNVDDTCDPYVVVALTSRFDPTRRTHSLTHALARSGTSISRAATIRAAPRRSRRRRARSSARRRAMRRGPTTSTSWRRARSA